MSPLVEKVAKALWESEPTIYSWGPQERHKVTWEDAVKRNLVGVTIFRAFARVAVEVIADPDNWIKIEK